MSIKSAKNLPWEPCVNHITNIEVYDLGKSNRLVETFLNNQAFLVD